MTPNLEKSKIAPQMISSQNTAGFFNGHISEITLAKIAPLPACPHTFKYKYEVSCNGHNSGDKSPLGTCPYGFTLPPEPSPPLGTHVPMGQLFPLGSLMPLLIFIFSVCFNPNLPSQN